MEQTQEQLWRKESHYFVVEIKVGNTWVEKGRAATEDDALLKGTRALQDPSVKASRVLLNQVQHTCSSVWEEKADTLIRVPPKMTLTERKADCPLCTLPNAVMTDGTTDWIMCNKCGKMLPV